MLGDNDSEGGLANRAPSSAGSDRPAPPVSSRRRPSISPSSAAMSGDNVKVVCRVRPFNRREYEIHDENNAGLSEWERQPLRAVVSMSPTCTKFLDYHHGFAEKESFNFDENLWSIPPEQQDSPCPFATQDTVFEKVGLLTLNQAFAGYNTCIFAYGQTGSGKTHTMMGTEDDKGLIPKCCEGVFERIQDIANGSSEYTALQQPGSETEWKVEACFLEIYNQHIKDLLYELADPAVQGQFDKDNLKMRNIPGQGPVVSGLTTVEVSSWEECQAIISVGMKNRVVAATKMNDASSRSHAIFRLTLTQTTILKPAKQWEKPKRMHRISTINLVDLAGSERIKKSGAEGQRQKEAAAINLSLTTLKNVIDALVEQRPVVPYRDSALTWLLSESLGGNSKTFMIACMSPHLDNAEESLNTMRYALRTQGIMNHAKVNESDEARRLAQLQREYDEAKKSSVDPDKTHRGQLKRAMEDIQVALTELEQRQYKQKDQEKALQATVEEEHRRTHQAIYINAFRAKLLDRINVTVTKRIGTFTEEATQIAQENEQAKSELARMVTQLREVTASVERSQIALKRTQRDHEKVKQQYERTQEDLKRIAEDGKQVVSSMRESRLRNNLTSVWCFGKVATARIKHQQEGDKVANSHAQTLQQASRLGQSTKTQYQLEHQRGISRIQADIEKTIEEESDVSQQIQATNDDRKAQLRRLNEDVTFYERENRYLDDERVQKITEIERTQSHRYQNEMSRLSERSVKNRQLIEQRHVSFMHEAARQSKMAGSEHEAALAEVDSQWGDKLKRAQGESFSASKALGLEYTSVLREHSAQIEDARTYLHNWNQSVHRYGSIYNELKELIAKCKNTPHHDPALRELLSKLEGDGRMSASPSRNPSPNRVPQRSSSPGDIHGLTLRPLNATVRSSSMSSTARSVRKPGFGPAKLGTPSRLGSRV